MYFIHFFLNLSVVLNLRTFALIDEQVGMFLLLLELLLSITYRAREVISRILFFIKSNVKLVDVSSMWSLIVFWKNVLNFNFIKIRLFRSTSCVISSRWLDSCLKSSIKRIGFINHILNVLLSNFLAATHIKVNIIQPRFYLLIGWVFRFFSTIIINWHQIIVLLGWISR